MTKKFDAIGVSLALAAAAAVEKMAVRTPSKPAPENEPLMALNFRIRQSSHKKLKAAALMWDMTMTELLEGFIDSLPDAHRTDVPPAKVTWTKPQG
jgi:hypothetical protein